jgi:diguanylate cyclase (GGDEF)-like protein/PAS domain S-box-containing protein
MAYITGDDPIELSPPASPAASKPHSSTLHGVDDTIFKVLDAGQARLLIAQEAGGIGVWDRDMRSGAVYWSPEQFLIYGVTQSTKAPEFTQWLAMVDPEDQPRVMQAHRDVASGAAPSFRLEFRIHRQSDGATRWILCVARVMAHWPGQLRLVGINLDVTDLRLAGAVLRQSDALFRATFEQAAVGMAQVNFDGSLIMINQRFCDMLGYSRADAMQLTFREVTHPDDLADSEAALCDFVASGAESYRCEKRYVRRDGTPLWVTLTVSLVRDELGQPHHCLAVVEDATARKLAEQELQESEARARRLFDGAPLPSYLVDPQTRAIVDTNEAATAMLGYSREEFRHLTLMDVDVTDFGNTEMPRQLQITGKPLHFESRQRGRDGVIHDVVVAAVPLDRPGGRLVHGTIVDISDRKRAEADLKMQAEQDGLTRLLSRNAFFKALEATLARAGPASGRGGALILVDIDDFKQVNDTVGHDAGDALLVEVAARLRARCRAGDIAARLGGDEFALLIPGMRDERAIAARMADILADMALPIETPVPVRQLHMGVSIGATRFPNDGTAARELVKNADLALHEAKRAGRSCWRFYRPEQAQALDRHVHMANALRRAIEAGELQVAFQPKRRLNGQHAGFEALARWQDAGGWVPPADFVPVAEATGLIRPLTRTVLDLSLARLRALRGRSCHPGRVAVNVSGADLLDAGFVDQTLAALRRHRLTPSDLELEVTETVLLGRTADRVDQVLRELRARGITLALDDFGTGFASLSHISRLSVDRIKIDKSFVSEIGTGGRAGLIARTVIGLARDLDIQSVAEGVETEAQLEFLAAENCDAAQGYLISPPLLTLEATAAYLQTLK